MQDHQLNRILKLVKRTGDKLIILDRENDDASVLMDLVDYEELIDGPNPLEDLNEREMMDRVNRDLANWRAYHEFDDEFDDEKGTMDDEFLAEEPAPLSDGEPLPVPEAENDEKIAEVSEKLPQEESLADVKAEEEEEKFYLEPVE